ncbi:hypothetical protein HRbin36_00465 [bacterium HR36]|nr:hypothetical protein HRbin36_00465 [bacterium HR36]
MFDDLSASTGALAQGAHRLDIRLFGKAGCRPQFPYQLAAMSPAFQSLHPKVFRSTQLGVQLRDLVFEERPDNLLLSGAMALLLTLLSFCGLFIFALATVHFGFGLLEARLEFS